MIINTGLPFFVTPDSFPGEGLEPESLACVLVLFFLRTKMMMARGGGFFFLVFFFSLVHFRSIY